MHNFHVIGIGSSSGGYAAVKTLFSHLHDKPGMSFLIIQHISQQHAPIEPEMMARHTSLPVLRAADGVSIEKDTIYLMPMDRILNIRQNTFYFNPNAGHIALTHSIDTLFSDISKSYGNKAIGILLSGKGTDGSLGIRSITEAGGIVMVQSPESATFSDMPQIAISSGYADLIMPPEQMATKLKEVEQDNLPGKTKDKELSIASEKEHVQKIIELLSEYSGVDFIHYKVNSLIRRIEKRMLLTRLSSAKEYFNYLQTHKHELFTLYKKSLIGVTDFFRDKEAFATFEQVVIPQLCQEKELYEQLRIWVPACSTGEEAYTIAILMEEYIRDHHLKVDYKLFATDLDESALEFASQGCYPPDALKNMSEERINRFFLQESSFYTINSAIRKKLLFVKHNLLKDPPFIRLDVVSCRNLYIYLKPEAQQQITNIFHYALKPGGFVMLGANEYMGESDTGFEKVDSKNRIYRNLASVKQHPLIFDSDINLPSRGLYKAALPKKELSNLPRLEDDMVSLLLQVYVSAAIVVNQKMEVVYLHGELSKYLRLPKQEMSSSLDKMLAPHLLSIIKSGIIKLKEGKNNLHLKDIRISNEGSESITDIKFRLLKSNSRDQLYFLIEFGKEHNDESATTHVTEDTTAEVVSMDYISNLETELKHTKQELIAITHELEANREELQASHEEMLSSNEELQSTNEELQSSNEELFSVNSELKRKIEELTTLNHDINNLFESTDIAILFLDEKLNIRKFTPSVNLHFKIRDTDIGRPLTDLNKSFKDLHFEKNLLIVLKQLEVIEKEVKNRNDNYYQLRIIPYRKDDENSAGLVITFVDITDLRNANKQLKSLATDLKRSEGNLQSLLNNTPDIIIRFDPELNHLFVNNSAKKFFRKKPRNYTHFDEYSAELFDKSEGERMKDKFLNVLKNGVNDEFYTTTFSKKDPIHFYVKLVAEFDQKMESPQSVLAIARDITPIKQAEIRLHTKNNELIRINEYLDEFVYAIAHDMRAPVANLLSIVKLFETGDNQSQEKLLHLLSKTVYRLDSTLNGLIDMIEAQESGNQQGEACIFKEIVEDIKNELLTKINESGAQIVCDFDKVPNIKYNKTYLYSIIRNLLSNAIKYRSSQRTPAIKLLTKQLENQGVMLSISDNGRGIDLKANGKALFKPFRRFDDDSEGKGIGLHIIKNMIERNGGKIKVESEVDKGTTFRMYLNAY
ncbi:CheR family methyltransferase [Catalinimonas sp. 4WD22]|uniref:CheR family methyltransferase n=1 Tax=Catalinimonas locisalis TaxID=3133978 RepID=UPI0031014A32